MKNICTPIDVDERKINQLTIDLNVMLLIFYKYWLNLLDTVIIRRGEVSFYVTELTKKQRENLVLAINDINFILKTDY